MAKKMKTKLPKKIAGYRVPKALRRSSGSLGTLVNHPLGREILADALIAAAGAAAAALVKHRPSGQQVARAGEAVAETGADAAAGTRDLVQTAAGAVAEVVAGAARTVLPATLTGQGESDRDRPERAGFVAARETKGKKDKHRDKHSRH